MVRFFIIPFAKLRLFELYYNFFDKFCNVKFEELEMDSDPDTEVLKIWFQSWCKK